MSIGRRLLGLWAAIALAAGANLACLPTPSWAFDIVLKDVAPDRIERQRAFYLGRSTLPGTPEVDKLDQRLSAKGVQAGAQMLIRIFKVESELELWMRSGDRYVLFATYPICHWSGTIGPKIKEGDKQAPEGFYSVALKQTRLVGQWRRAFNVGFPNPLDQFQSRTGSNILVHGGCSSVGCFAMTNPVMEEIFQLMQAAFKAGQERVQVHIFPFRMTAENMELHKDSPWVDGWRDLQAGHDLFQTTGVPPHVAVCDRRYVFRDGRLDLDWDPYQVLPVRTSGGESGSRCGGEEAARVAMADGDDPSKDGGRARSAASIITGSLPPSVVAARSVALSTPASPALPSPMVYTAPEPPPTAATTSEPSRSPSPASGDRRTAALTISTAAPATPTKSASSPPSRTAVAAVREEVSRPPVAGPAPAAKGRGGIVVPAALAPPRRAEEPERRRRVRARGRAASASTDINDRPEFIAVRRGAP